jgi:predicted acetyltransferase
MVTFRHATDDDIDELVDVHARAYPYPLSQSARMRRFSSNPIGPLSNLVLAERDGQVVAHGFAHPAGMYVRGREVAVCALASVGVAPEARGQGIATRLVGELERVSRERGDKICVLYPFREHFYSRLGYGRASAQIRLRFSPEAIARRTSGLTARRMGSADLDSMRAIYTHSVARGVGALVRNDAMWNLRVLDESAYTVLVENSGSPAVGFLTYHLDQEEAHAEIRARVTDFHGETSEAIAALYTHLAHLKDQVHVIELDTFVGDPWIDSLLDADVHRFGTEHVEHPMGIIMGGPMVKLYGTGSLRHLPFATDGTLGIVVSEPSERIVLTVENGVAHVAPGAHDLSIELSRSTLARVAVGGFGVKQAALLGLVLSTSGAALERAHAMFASAPFFSYDRF